MALAAKIHSSIWSDDDFGALDAAGKLAILWVWTNKDMTNIGYLKVQGRAFQNDTGLEVKVLEGALKGLTRSFLFEDRKGGLGVLSLNYVRYQFSDVAFHPNNNVCKNLVSLARGLSEEMQEALCERYKGLVSLLQMGFPREGAYKGLISPQSRAVQSRAEQSSEEEGSGGKGAAGISAGVSAQKAGEKFSKSGCTNVPHGTKPGLDAKTGGEGQSGEGQEDEAEGWEGQVVRQGRVSNGGLDFVAAEGLLRFLNERTGGLYPATPPIVREIALRLAEVGGDVAGCRRMIEQRVMAWSGDGKMAQFLRPDTLFKAEKFPIYFGQREQTAFGVMGEERKREQRKELEGRIERSRANRQSAYHSSEATAEEREALKGWRRELAELEKA